MAISANAKWEVRTGGDDTNGGGFVTGASGTDRSQQDAAHGTFTVTVHTTTTQFNIAGYTVSAADIGNVIQIATGGTMTAGFYQITNADVPNNRWTVDRSGGTAAQTGSGKIGGALASIGGLGSAIQSGTQTAGCKAFIRSGTYTLTTSTPNVSGGPFSNGTNIRCQIIGYNATGGREDLSASPLIDVGAITTITVFDMNNFQGMSIVNITVDGQTNASVIGFDLAGNEIAFKCTAIDCTTGFTSGGGCRLMYNKAQGCTSGFASANSIFYRNWADGCTTGFSMNNNNNVDHFENLATDCTTGFATTGNNVGLIWVNNVADGCTDGWAPGAGGLHTLINNISSNNSDWGFEMGATTTEIFWFGNYTYNNTGGALRSFANNKVEIGTTALSADPWENAASDDYKPNNTSGGGAVIRGAGEPIPGQASNHDVGAVQHDDPVRGGSYTFVG